MARQQPSGRAVAASGRIAARWAAVGLSAAIWLAPSLAAAVPGVPRRLGGIEPAGPASRSVTALHHNPAMLAALSSSAAHIAFDIGLEQQRIRRNAIDPTTGSPIESLDAPVNLAQPDFGYFLGASLYLDPWAIGIGIYDLDSRYRISSADTLRYHLAPDPDPGCLAGPKHCKPNGGSVISRHDLTLALAYNGGIFQLGAAAHFPILQSRFAYDEDAELAPASGENTVTCDRKEDPDCAERIGFRGWTHWIPRGDNPGGFDVALTFGIAVELANGRVRLGARYRTFPLRRNGRVLLGGVALVCRPNPRTGAEAEDPIPACSVADPASATLSERLPQEVGIGASLLLGPAQIWRLDTNFVWSDLCPGGRTPGSCADDGSQSLRVIGLDRQDVSQPEFIRYRGRQDQFSVDVMARRLVRSNLFVLFGAHLSTPSVIRGAQTAAEGEGTRLGGSAGVRLRRRKTEIVIVPGYGLDIEFPHSVSTGLARFNPADAQAFADASGDLNSPGADAVLAGRARPTNAGRYFGVVHTLSLALLWGERSGMTD